MHYTKKHLADYNLYYTMADSILRTIRADVDLYKRIGAHARLFAFFGCSSENGSDS